MSTYEISKIQLPNGDICNLKDTHYFAGSGLALDDNIFSNTGVRSIDTGVTYGTISVNTGGTAAEVAVRGLGSIAYKNDLIPSDITGLETAYVTTDTNQTIIGTKTFTQNIVGSITGNAATATAFSAAKAVNLTGDITGSAESVGGWSITTTLASSGVAAGNYGPTANTTVAHGGTITVPYLTVDAKGRTTKAYNRTITLPSASSTNDYTTAEKQKLASITQDADAVSISGTLSSGTQIGILSINGVETTIYTPNDAPQTIAVTQSANTPTLEFIIGTHTSSTSSLKGVLSTTTAIANGKIIFYRTPYALPQSQHTLELNYADSGNTTGAIPIYAHSGQRNVVPYPAGSILVMVYYNSGFYIVNNTIAPVSSVGSPIYNNGDEVSY